MRSCPGESLHTDPQAPSVCRAPRGYGFVSASICLALLTLVTAAQAQSPIESEDLEEPAPRPTAEASGHTSPSESPPLSNELLDLERLAEESFAQDDLTTAVALYRQLADRHTHRSEKIRVMMVVGWLQHQRGASGEAMETLTEVLILDPSYTFRPDLYSEDFAPLFYDAQKRALQTRRANASELVSEGSALLRSQRYAEARVKLTRAVEIWPEQARGIYNLALVDYYDQRLDNAFDGFQKVLALAAAKPDVVDAQLQALALTNLSLLYMERGQDLEAAEALRRAVVLDPANATAWLNLGIASRRSGDTARAAEAFQRAWDLNKSDVGAGRNLALAYLDSGRPEAAARLLEQMTSDHPSEAGLWLYLGMAKKAMGDASGAALAFEASIAHDPDNRSNWAGQAALQLAATLYGESDFQGARRQAQRVVRWLPNQVNGWVYLGLAQQSLGDRAAALESLQTALRLDPARADIHNSTGSVLFELSRFDEAEQAFRRALEIEPQLAGAQRNLEAVLTVKRGDAVAGKRGSAPPRATPRTRQAPPPKPAPRPSLGFRFSDVDYASLGLQGVMVEQVYPNTAAARAGAQADDLLLKMDGRPISSADALRDYAASLSSGQAITLELLRDNRPVTIRLNAP